MAVLGRLLISSAERLDLPDILSIDSYAAGDWKYFLKGLVGSDTPYILKGFDVISPNDAIGTQSCSIRIADSAVFFPTSTAGSFYFGLPEGNVNAQPLIPELRKNATNFIYVTFTTTNKSSDTRAFWDPDTNGGSGGEFTQDVNTESVLTAQINVSTGSFPVGTLPIAKIIVGAVVITSIQDCRNLLFRLGSGGVSPDQFHSYPFRGLPSDPYKRVEPPTTMSTPSDPNSFQGADKNFESLKEWMDVVMQKLKELGGTTFWYEDASTFSLINGFSDSLGTTFKSKGNWKHSSSTPGAVTWTEDVIIKGTLDPRDIIIRNGSILLANEDVAFLNLIRDVPLNTLDQPVAWTNGANYINTIGGAIGLFENLAKGDWVKKKSDPKNLYLRVEEFYDGINLGGSVTTAALAKSIRLNDNYQGVDGNEIGRYQKGVYQSTDVSVVPRSDNSLAAAGGNATWLAERSDTIENIASIVDTTLTISIAGHDGQTATCTSTGVHGLINNDNIIITGSTNFNGTYLVDVIDTTKFSITKVGGPFGDESGRTASYAIVTTAARSTAYGLQLESANHNFQSGDTAIIGGTVNYNGAYIVSNRSATTFQIATPPSLATENTGTATIAVVIVRAEGSLTRIIQGETINIGDGAANNIKQYLGMTSLDQTFPNYAISGTWIGKTGEQNYGSIVSDNITDRVSRLTAMMADKAQDKTIVFAPSSYDYITNTTSGSNQVVTFTSSTGGTPRLDVIVPSGTATGSVILTGSLTLAANEIAYISVDRNTNFAYANLAAVTVGSIATMPLDENTYVLAVRLAGNNVWLWDGTHLNVGNTDTITQLELVINQDRNIKLVRGGNWGWTVGTSTLTWDEDASIQVPGIVESRNNILSNSAVLANDGDVAYVEINRIAGSPSNLTVNVSSISSLVPTDNTVIIARRFGSSSIVAQQTVNTAGDALDNGGSSTAIGNPFVVSSPTTITDIAVQLNKVGTPAGNITVSLQTDSGGNPSGTILESLIIPVSSITTAPSISTFHLTTSIPVTAGTYHIVFTSDATYKASFSSLTNFVSIKRDSTAVTPPLEEYFNGSVWSHAVGGALYYVVTSALASSVIVGSHSFSLVNGESKKLDQGMSNQNLLALGLTDESQSALEYSVTASGSLSLPNYNTVDNEVPANRMSKLTAMLADVKQDLNIEFDPGTITWDGTNITVTSAQLSIPGTTVGASPVNINNLGSTALASNSCLYVDINRTSSSALTLSTSTLSALTPSQQRLVLIRNVSGNLFVR